MINLLSLNFARLKKNKMFLLGTALMFAAGVILPLSNFADAKKSGGSVPMDTSFFSYAVFIVILMSVFCSLFIGTEHSDGTIRNKIIVGHKRSTVYLSNLIVGIVTGFIMCAAYVVPYLCIGIPLLGKFEAGTNAAVILIIAVFFMSVAFVSFFTMVSMLCQNKSITAVICIISAFMFLFAGTYINSRINEPEKFDGYVYTLNGETYSEAEEINPNYISGTKRKVYEFMYDFLPGCQAVQIVDMSTESIDIMPLYSLIVTFITSAAGIVIFRKKDLK